MDSKILSLLFGILLMGSTAFAISGATVGPEVERGRWSGLSAGSYATEGGNISGVNISSATLTDRWASFYGNVTGSIRLTGSTGVSNVYTWSWTPATGGEVCLSQDANFPWASAETAVRADIDTAFGFAAGADQAADTYTDASQTITIHGLATITSTGTTLQGNSTFANIAIGDGVEAAVGDFAFCTDIDTAGKNWLNQNYNYEIMVPTDDSPAATTTYYFFAELN